MTGLDFAVVLVMTDVVRCASSGQANRVPGLEAGKRAVCGRCKAPLLGDAGHPGVQGIPLLVFFRDGAEKGRVTGAVPKGQIEAAVARFLG